LITEVNHVITAGEFQTSFSGIRQGIYDLPSIDNFLQSINQNLLTQIETVIQNNKDNITDKPTTMIDETALLTQQGDNVAAAANTCTNNLNENYATWGDFVESVTIGLTPQKLADAIKAKTDIIELQTSIYMLCYVLTFNKNQFEGYNNNFASVALNTNWGELGIKYFIQQQSSCVKLPNSLGAPTSQPIANFESLDKFLDFMIDRLTPNLKRIYFGANGNAPLGLAKYYVCYWKPPTDGIPNITEQYYDQNLDSYKVLFDTLDKGYKSAAKVGLDFETARTAANSQTQQIINGVTGATNNLNTTTPPPPTCLPPTIVSFSPLTGVTNTILNITGTHLENITAVTINNITTTTGITINNSTNIVVLVPFSNTTIPQNNTIVVSGPYGSSASSITFTYNPLQTSAAPPTVAPNLPPNVNTNSQQTGPIPMIGQTQNGVTFIGNASVNVNINPVLIGSYTFLPTNNYPNMKFKVTQENVVNNSAITSTVYESNIISLGNTYLTPTNFYMNQANILSVITSNWQTPPSNCNIICEFTLFARSLVSGQLSTNTFKLNIQL
jgi:hypothetical protein